MTNKSDNSHNSAKQPAINEQDDYFQAYLARQSALSDSYKKIDCAEPSDKLNQSILSAARAAAAKQSRTKKWWTQAGSWAASVAIISLVGMLAHNTWQTEQHDRQKNKAIEDPAPHVQQTDSLKQKPAEKADKTRMEFNVPLEEQTQTPARAKKNMLQDNEKDSRKLLYQSAPAPVMQPSAGYFKLNKKQPLLNESQLQEFDTLHEEIFFSSETGEKSVALTEQQSRLNKIIQLIENEQIVQAQKLLSEFKAKYPDYPVDPEILKQLTPY